MTEGVARGGAGGVAGGVAKGSQPIRERRLRPCMTLRWGEAGTPITGSIISEKGFSQSGGTRRPGLGKMGLRTERKNYKDKMKLKVEKRIKKLEKIPKEK